MWELLDGYEYEITERYDDERDDFGMGFEYDGYWYWLDDFVRTDSPWIGGTFPIGLDAIHASGYENIGISLVGDYAVRVWEEV